MKPAIYLIILFLISQIIGILIINEYIDVKTSSETGETVIFEDKYLIPPPDVASETYSFVYILVTVLFGTILLLLLIKFKLGNIWKIWYIFAIFLAIAIALHPFLLRVSEYGLYLTIFLAITLVYLRLKHQEFSINMFTEMLIYGGIAALFVPILNIYAISILLIIMSIYDIFAVRGSKHMITLAKFQTESKLFAGFSVGKRQETLEQKVQSTSKASAAMLGGGDIAFPLLFSGVILKTIGAFYPAILTSVGATIGLAILFYFAEKGKYYPALPPVSIGCFLGYFSYILFF